MKQLRLKTLTRGDMFKILPIYHANVFELVAPHEAAECKGEEAPLTFAAYDHTEKRYVTFGNCPVFVPAHH